MVCEECGRGLRFKTGYNLCITCMNDLVDENYERFMQAEYKAEGERVFKCPKCGGLDCIHGDFAIDGIELHNGTHYDSFKPKLMPTKGEMWCQYLYNGEMVQGNTLLDEIQELSFACTECGYNFNGQDDELNKNIVIVHE